MPRTATRVDTVYTLAELKEQHPKGYARVHQRWKDACDGSGDMAWADETMDSLKAVVKACGGRLKDWSIGPYSYSSIDVVADDSYTVEDESAEYGERDVVKDSAWLVREVLAPLGYVDALGRADFPGHCKFTGYCADDSFLESVWRSMASGDTLTDALRGLADVARKMMENDLEKQKDQESMEANWEGLEFTADGEEFNG